MSLHDRFLFYFVQVSLMEVLNQTHGDVRAGSRQSAKRTSATGDAFPDFLTAFWNVLISIVCGDGGELRNEYVAERDVWACPCASFANSVCVCNSLSLSRYLCLSLSLSLSLKAREVGRGERGRLTRL